MVLRRLSIIGALLITLNSLTGDSAQAAGRSGSYVTAPAVIYNCSALGTPAVSVNFSSVEVVDTDPSITITPGGSEPGSMTGSIAEPVFSVQRVFSGGCTVTHSIDGAFTSSTEFTATYDIAFSGFECSFSDCSDQSFQITGNKSSPVPSLSAPALILLGAALVTAAARRLTSRYT